MSAPARSRVPAHTLAQLDAYVNNRTPPGSFVHAVLCNDLYSVIRRTDDANYANLKAIVEYVDFHLPMESRGSPEAVRAWLDGEV
jgi:hypothetical protein